MRKPCRPLLLTAALAASEPVLAASEAERIAGRTGEVIGGAAACGVSEAELVALGREVIGWARDPAKNAAELRRAQAAHEAAVNRGASRIEVAGQGACAAMARTFRRLEREWR